MLLQKRSQYAFLPRASLHTALSTKLICLRCQRQLLFTPLSRLLQQAQDRRGYRSSRVLLTPPATDKDASSSTQTANAAKISPEKLEEEKKPTRSRKPSLKERFKTWFGMQSQKLEEAAGGSADPDKVNVQKEEHKDVITPDGAAQAAYKREATRKAAETLGSLTRVQIDLLVAVLMARTRRSELEEAERAIAVSTAPQDTTDQEFKKREATKNLANAESVVRALSNAAAEEVYGTQAKGKLAEIFEPLSNNETSVLIVQERMRRCRMRLKSAEEAIAVSTSPEQTTCHEEEKGGAAKRLRKLESKLRHLTDGATQEGHKLKAVVKVAKNLEQHKSKLESLPSKRPAEKSRKAPTLQELKQLENIMRLRNLRLKLEKLEEVDSVSTGADDMIKGERMKAVLVEQLRAAERKLKLESSSQSSTEDMMQMSDQEIRDNIKAGQESRLKSKLKSAIEAAGNIKVPEKASVQGEEPEDNNTLAIAAQETNREEASNEKCEKRRVASEKKREKRREEREAAYHESHEKSRLEERVRHLEEKLALVLAAGGANKGPDKVNVQTRESEDSDSSVGAAQEEGIKGASSLESLVENSPENSRRLRRQSNRVRRILMKRELRIIRKPGIVSAQKEELEDDNSSDIVSQDKKDTTLVRRVRPALPRMQIKKAMKTKSSRIRRLIGKGTKVDASTVMSTLREKAAQLESRREVLLSRRNKPAQEGAQDDVLSHKDSASALLEAKSLGNDPSFESIKADELELAAIEVDQPPAPRLAYGLDRALFHQGVTQMRDTRSGVYNFDPSLESLIPVDEFDFGLLKGFTTPSQDKVLDQLARESNKKYVASTSSMTGILSHFHFLLSQQRSVNTKMISADFPLKSTNYTKITQVPASVFLRWQDGKYAVDANKEWDGPNILSMMGRYMERLLTVDKDTFERHQIGSSNPLAKEEASGGDAYHYSTVGDFLIRSQLDAADRRLPGSGVFDLKTRAVLPIRMSTKDFTWAMEYEIQSMRGEYNSFEREYFDMIRSTMLKYSLQVRLGRMDGIFVAYHNIAKIFGFQYISIADMDEALHGQRDPSLGDQELLLSLHILNQAFNQATTKFPEQSLRLTFETRPVNEPFMYIFAEPVAEEDIGESQNRSKDLIEAFENEVLRRDTSSDASQLGVNERMTVFKARLSNLNLRKLASSASSVGDAGKSSSSSETTQSEDSPQTATEDTSAPVLEDVTDASANKHSTATEDTSAPVLEDVTDASANKHSTATEDTSAPVLEDVTDASTNRHSTAAEDTSAPVLEDVTDASTNRHSAATEDTSAPVLEDMTDASANKHSTATIEPKSEAVPEPKPLLAMTLAVKNRINNQQRPRPKLISIEGGDEWEVNYRFSDIKRINRAWQLYEACKARRRSLLENSIGTEEDASEASVKDDYFIRMLKHVTQQSRKPATALREGDVEGETKMWNQP